MYLKFFKKVRLRRDTAIDRADIVGFVSLNGNCVTGNEQQIETFKIILGTEIEWSR